ncbi:MAG: LytR C-terminal domain-containing protein [Actinomycetota bacterium]
MRVATEHIDDGAEIEPEPGPRLGGTDVFRGALVILTALVIGGFIIGRGLDATDTDVDEVDPAAATIEGEATGDAELTPADGLETSTTTIAPAPATTATTAVVESTEVVPTTPALRPPAEVKVLVLNGAQVQGIAGRATEALQAASYLTGEPKNATSQRPSAVYYVEGYEADARAVAEVFGPDLDTLVQPLDPTDVPIDDTQGAHVLVVIGGDDLIPVF